MAVDDSSLDQSISLDPVLTQRTQGPSPEEERVVETERDQGVLQRLARAEASGPTIRQRTQSEIIDLSLLQNQLGNPFSVRWIPFEQLREMTTDLMLAFGWWMTITPIVRAEWSIASPNARLAAAVDEALRPIIAETLLAFSNSLWYGHQPAVKRFRLGKLGGTYRDPNSEDSDKDIPVWDSSADALLWRPPATLNPSHCLPQWDEDGQMVGFKFSQTPIPHNDLISAASAYGYMVIPGHFIGPDYALWLTNEESLNFGSCFGAARTKRAYPFWWSFWFRWRLADRSYENLADPPKVVYYPVDFDQYIDPDDPDQENPMVKRARQTALDLGNQTRSGATLAVPGSLAETSDGHVTTMRKWDIGYLDGKNNFSELDATFKLLDVYKLRSWFIPEQSMIEGTGSRTAGGSSGGTGGARMATQLGQVYEESQQLLVNYYDSIINEYMIPQFIAANFPELVGTPCKKVSRSLGVLDEQTRSQVFQLIGQVRGEVLPVDVRALLEQMNIPLLNEMQLKKEVQQISELAALMGPPVQDPEKVGTQGYNAGVVKTARGNQYAQPPQRIVLAESDGFMNSLPDTPHYRDAGVRSRVVRLRRLLLERYEQQYGSFVDFLRAQPTLHLAQDQRQKTGLDEQQASAAAASIVALWSSSHAAGAPGHSSQVVATEVGGRLADLVGGVALSGGRSALKGARLDAEDFGSGALDPWVKDRVKFALDSIDGTVRDECRSWLGDELQKTVDPAAVADAAKEHFQDFPKTHADRATRTETRDAFNRGTLEALHRAGVAQVQAVDASDGTDATTDAECQARQGRVYSVEDAMDVDEHQNGTLGWVPLSTERLSVERVPELPAHLAVDGLRVAYDEGTETLYLTDDLEDAHERALLLMLGDQLKLSS
jgi:hypothetical protein